MSGVCSETVRKDRQMIWQNCSQFDELKCNIEVGAKSKKLMNAGTKVLSLNAQSIWNKEYDLAVQ